MGQKDRTDPIIGRSRVRVCANGNAGTSGHAAAHSEAREGCSGLVGDACARQLDGGVRSRRPTTTLPSTVTQMFVVGVEHLSLRHEPGGDVRNTGSGLKGALSDMH